MQHRYIVESRFRSSLSVQQNWVRHSFHITKESAEQNLRWMQENWPCENVEYRIVKE